MKKGITRVFTSHNLIRRSQIENICSLCLKGKRIKTFHHVTYMVLNNLFENNSMWHPQDLDLKILLTMNLSSDFFQEYGEMLMLLPVSKP